MLSRSHHSFSLCIFFPSLILVCAAIAAVITTSSAADEAVIEVKHGSVLGNGLFRTHTPVPYASALALDIRDISAALSSGNRDLATDIYLNGKNAHSTTTTNEEGWPTRTKTTLASLSKTSAMDGEFDLDPEFLFQIYGFVRGEMIYDEMLDSHHVVDYVEAGKRQRDYANDFVIVSLEDENSGVLASEAALALNFYMYTLHKLSESVRRCASSSSPSYSSFSSSGSENEPKDHFAGKHREENPQSTESGSGVVHALDEFIAYYVGDGQRNLSQEDKDDVHSLYALAEVASQFFGTTVPSTGRSNVNAKMKILYEAMISLLNPSPDGLRDTCENNLSTFQEMWRFSRRITSITNIPLVQMLLKALADKDSDRIKLYAVSIVPRLSACKPSVHKFLSAQLLDQEYDPANYVDVVLALQSVYECLGITCADVGTYTVPGGVGGGGGGGEGLDHSALFCEDTPAHQALAGYVPTTAVGSLSKIDLDIHQIHILCSMGAFKAANVIYSYGKNSQMTLKEMATTKERYNADPIYDYYQIYHNDENYADTVIEEAMNGLGRWRDVPIDQSNVAQRTEIIVNTLRFQIVYMYALLELHDAELDCLAKDPTRNKDMANAWDEAVAVTVGSMEGPNAGGSVEDGQLIYNLANRLCKKFDRCTLQGWSKLENVMQDLFYAGKGELIGLNCDALRLTVQKITHIMVVPLIQAVLDTAAHNGKNTPFSSSSTKTLESSVTLAAGEAYALSILPMVDHHGPEAADLIERNMLDQETNPVSDGAQAVADAFSTIMTEFGIPCQYVGFYQDGGGLEVCDGEMISRQYGAAVASTLPGVTSTAIFALMSLFMAMVV